MRDEGRKVGSFMIAVGAIIELKGTGKILVGLRDTHEVNHGTWEMIYGRIDHHEELTTALKREVFEEAGISDLKIKKVNRIWHIYRGEKRADKEVYGITFICESATKQPTKSEEHSEFRWVKPEDALKLNMVPGVKREIEIYIENKKVKTNVVISDLANQEEVF